MSKKAFISGISGQDGSYLAELLLEKGYAVHGMIRRQSTPENQESRIAHLEDRITTHYGDVLDKSSIDKIIRKVKPTHIFNLAAQSHVRVSFEIPNFTVQANAIGTMNMLESYREFAPEAKFYQASSSEMFGLTVDEDNFQRESTAMNPTSPYGCAKVFAYNMVRHYRRAYKLHACNGILFNHESPRRGSNFVTNKVVKAAVMISMGKQDVLELGNMDAQRDWGHSKDYVKAMELIINHRYPDDFVVSTMKTHSVRQMCQIVFSYLGLDYKEYVIQNPKFLRPEELPYLRGDSTKIRKELDWKPDYTLKATLHEMVDHWTDVLNGKKSTR
jgi:GDPmannose 4,6-dehydratase